MNHEQFLEFLKKHDACNTGIDFVKDNNYDLKDAIDNLKDREWLFWLANSAKVEKKVYVKISVDCARSVLQFVKEGEGRPLLAIQAAESWLADPSVDNENSANDAARDAVWAASASASAYASAYAASAAADPADPADPVYASYASYAADDDSAADSAAILSIVKKHITPELIMQSIKNGEKK